MKTFSTILFFILATGCTAEQGASWRAALAAAGQGMQQGMANRSYASPTATYAQKSVTCQVIGQMLYCSDGTTCQRIGNMTYCR